MRLKIGDVLKGVLGCDVVLEHSRDCRFGHFSTPVSFSLARERKGNPHDIAKNLSNEIRNGVHGVFSEVSAVNGYINVKLSPNFLQGLLDVVVSNEMGFANSFSNTVKKEEVLLEYVSANPTGPLHIGHARCAIFGSVLQNIGQYIGHTVDSEYYVNDAGNQIKSLGISILNSIVNKIGAIPEVRNVLFPLLSGDVSYSGDYIDVIAEEFLKSKERNNLDVDLAGRFGKDLILEGIKSDLASIGVNFSNYVSEKEMLNSWDEVLSKLDESGAIKRQDGVTWILSSIKGDSKDRVLIKSNGELTYLAGDIVYHKYKFERRYDRYLSILGADHHGYLSRIKAGVDYLGFDSDKLEVILSQMVSLLKDGKPYKMSKRAGNFVTIKDVVEDIGQDSLRFVFLSKSVDTHLEFDLSALERDDVNNPVYYINYANSRINTLMDKSRFSVKQILESDITEISDQGVMESCTRLLVVALDFPYLLKRVYEDRTLHKLCEYLRNLGKMFHSFYNTYKILGFKYESHVLKIMLVLSLVFTTGFRLMGVKIKTKM